MKRARQLQRNTSEKIFTFSVCVTGRCNSSCSYCHYYAGRKRRSVGYDISTEQFTVYMNFIRYWRDRIGGIVSFRFSGGEPTLLRDRLFDLVDAGHRITGLKPFILTSGVSLCSDWAEKAKQSHVSHVFVSIENPIKPDRKAPNPFRVVRAIKELDSDETPIVPGVCVVPNDCFKYLYDICKWFYSELGTLPAICEINYSAYESPTEAEWRSLEDIIPRIITDFSQKAQLSLFSSVVPECAYNGLDPYVFDLDLENSHSMTVENYKDKLEVFVDYQEKINYPELACNQSECPWVEFCQHTKWYWQNDTNKNRHRKLRDYCRFKRIMCDSYYRAFVDPSHSSTTCEVRV